MTDTIVLIRFFQMVDMLPLWKCKIPNTACWVLLFIVTGKAYMHFIKESKLIPTQTQTALHDQIRPILVLFNMSVHLIFRTMLVYLESMVWNIIANGVVYVNYKMYIRQNKCFFMCWLFPASPCGMHILRRPMGAMSSATVYH